MSVLLTDEEIKELRDWDTDSNGDEYVFYNPEEIAKAQLKKVVVWLEEEAGHYCKEQQDFLLRYLRTRALLKEIKD